SPEADITSIPVVRPEEYSTRKSEDIPVSVEELVYGRKAEGERTSAKSLDMHNKLLSSSEEVHGPRKDPRPSEWLNYHVLQRTSQKDTSLVDKPKHFVRGPKEGKHPSRSSSSLHKPESKSKNAKKRQASPKEQSEAQEKGKVQV
ncbi:hypothetical protein O181_052045, partial [Austropuccinia psidii MF-1]|nr:hypothetical protein [Austropuccinia psidii MF-1]